MDGVCQIPQIACAPLSARAGRSCERPLDREAWVAAILRPYDLWFRYLCEWVSIARSDQFLTSDRARFA